MQLSVIVLFYYQDSLNLFFAFCLPLILAFLIN